MAANCLTTLTEQWIRDKLRLKHQCLGDVRSLTLPGTREEKIRHLGNALVNFVRLKSLDLSYNALVSVKGVQHVRALERLILYYNCIPSPEDVKELYQLPALRELDLRLNPLTKSHPNYRLLLVHNMSSLRKLDGCSIKDTERKIALMQFSSDLPQQNSPTVSQAVGQRSSDPRLAAVKRFIQRQSLLTDTNDMVLNFLATTQGKEPHGDESTDYSEQRSSTPMQEDARSILRYPPTGYGIKQSTMPHPKVPSQNRSFTSLKVTDRPKVTFDPYVEKHNPENQEQKILPKQSRQAAQGHFTPNPNQSYGHSSSFGNVCPPSTHQPDLNLSDPSNPVLHPPRLTYSSFNNTEGSFHLPQEEKRKRGCYRKPLEMLLNLVDKHWREERSLQQNNNFLSQAVHILSMMETDISSREAEVKTLKRENDALTFQLAAQEEKNKTELSCISAQLEEARSEAGQLKEQLKTVLGENVSLQKQLSRLERRCLKSMMKCSQDFKINEVQTEIEDLKREIAVLREKVQESEKGTEL